MTEIIKIEDLEDVKGDRIWVTDKTGAYDASLNVGGYGAPNEERANLAILCYVRRIPLEGDNIKMEQYGPEIIYNNSLPNTEESEWQVKIDRDSWYKISLIAIINSSAGLSTGQFYYDTATSEIKRITTSGTEVITDYEELVDPDDSNIPNQSTCEKFLWMSTKIKLNKLWRQYKDGLEDVDCDAQAIFDRHTLTKENAISAHNQFWAGLQTESVKSIEELIEELEDIE